LGDGAKDFVAALKKASEQYLRAAAVAWGGDVRESEHNGQHRHEPLHERNESAVDYRREREIARYE